ncbi:Putative Glycerophosphoryl diester phosphodiesterase family protein (AFU_orthologue; AFUA_6G12240) [Aspergillus calidoustus]|jgi:glycerophosphoryl diester phosphodiesterase|uniref:glycerophosphodiester phosphodiesterase n=1 Tax=Aspergillus calidoustus TaxID=454130 RepID=A0A0U5G3V5_ASPCI|nr:Putative Glycerophosphoryl diester phosphodiesterase family protein (AFU_orthologue; AFUA_6G12240) [Aspergillus calidoustus]
MHALSLLVAAGIAVAAPAPGCKPQYPGKITNIQVGPRPFWLVDQMEDSALKTELAACSEKPIRHAPFFSISHRGGPVQFPEHSREGLYMGARMGAGVLECDVAFTSDRQLVCRHSQCDLHTTTDILLKPELAAKCTTPFTPATADSSATAKCCTSDITHEEFLSLCAKMDSSNPNATTPEEYQYGGPSWRTTLYDNCATTIDHKTFINITNSLGLQFTPELKTPEVEMPFQGEYTQEMYAQQLIDEYKEAGINPKRVWPQSFLEDDILYWIKAEPTFGKQAVYLDPRVDTPEGYEVAVAAMEDLYEQGVRVMAPPIFALLNTSADGEIVPSSYATAAKEAGMDIITWSLERSGPLKQAAAAGEYYIATIADVIKGDGDMYRIVDALARKVGVKAIFSDWPATVTYYANCVGLA